ncbi:DUF2306 domain-containing protein [Amycolatopsis sp. OK19-0408]|uniref:DUF2306 domain-containing protein n=1 Tax=Amycolatopsis iheyensis TaxID=2945988 RepID=A0A9X2N7I5_9PSEU|nr:DUF2306 domain-containing protein [Amycolatopsis iheyensis]MCR6481654.1 DUF2306 domain-containing protein [Amycolatopsis iheyensis]
MRKTWLVFAVALGFGAVLVYPYLGLDIDDSRLSVRSSLQYAVLVAHIFTAAVALVLGPLQFVPKIRARRRVHRTLGRLYLFAGVLPSGLATIPVALWSGRLVTQLGLTTAGVLWLVTGALAYRAARRRDFAAHRAWMLRNYALTFLAVTSRVLVPVLLLVQVPFGGVDPASAPTLIPIGQTLGWVVNLAVVEILLRQRPATRSPRRTKRFATRRDAPAA